MSKAQHTPGPWDSEKIRKSVDHMDRMKVCMDACEGISTEALEELLSRGITLKMLIEASSGFPFSDVLAKAKGE